MLRITSLLNFVVMLLGASVALIAPAVSVFAAADAYPTKPIRLVIPYPPGGALDTLGRPIADKLAKRLGTPVVIENRGGGGTVIGAELVAKAAPDGYTLLLNSSAFATSAAVEQVPYDPLKSFTQVARLVILTHLLVAHPSVPANSAADLIALAKKSPGKLIFGTSGYGGDTHIRTEQLKAMTGVDVKIVHFKGAGPQMIDLIGGHSDVGFISLTAMRPQLEAGKAKVLANSAGKRSVFLPDVPAVKESVPGFAFSLWVGLAAPAGTPAPIVERLNKEIGEMLAVDEEVKKTIREIRQEPSYLNSAEFTAFVEREIAEYTELTKQFKIKLK